MSAFRLFLICIIIGIAEDTFARLSAGDYLNLSNKYSSKNSDSCIFFAELGIKEAKNNDSLLTRLYKNIGLAQYYKGNHPVAIENYQKAERIAERNQDYEMLLDLHNLMGTLYNKNKQIDKAEAEFRKGLLLALQVKNISKEASALNDLGYVYMLKNKIDSAGVYYKKAADLYRRVGDDLGLSYSLNFLSEVYLEKNDFREAINLLQQSLALRLKIKDEIQISYSFNNLGELFYIMKDYSNAEKNFKLSLSYSEKLNVEDLRQHTYRMLSKVFVAKKDFETALKYQIKHEALKDSLFNETNSRIVKEMDSKYQSEKKQLQIENLNKQNEIKSITISKQRNLSVFLIVGVVLMIVISMLIFTAFRSKQKANKIITSQKEEVEKQKLLVDEKNEELIHQNEEIAAQRDLIENQKHLVEEKQKEVIDSINYAKRIQSALLTSENYIKENLIALKQKQEATDDYFILFKPKDIVSGDFYWFFSHVNGDGKVLYYFTGDCTGHGVPGGFMSMLGINLLNEIVIERSISEPKEILNKLREAIIKALKTDGEQAKDGMDGVLCKIDFDKRKLTYAAANNGFYLIRKNELQEYKADKMPVGYMEDMPSFSQHEIELREGDLIYTFTDGFADQFGGPKGKKLMYKQFEKLLLDCNGQPLIKQKEILDNALSDWKGNLDQVDDICVVGLRV